MKKFTCCGAGLTGFLNTKLFKALADPTRVGLLAHLAGCCRPVTVGEAAQCCPIDLSVVSRHLAVLRDAGVLDAAKEGREVRYAVRYPQLIKALRDLADALESCCPMEPEKAKEKKDARKK